MKMRTPFLMLMTLSLVGAACGNTDPDVGVPATAPPSSPTGPTTVPTPTQLPIEAPPGDGQQPSPTPGEIDYFPILDPSDFPASGPEIVLTGGWRQTTGDYGWMGLIGASSTAPDRAPTKVTRIQAMPASSLYEPQSVPGRRDGVRESTFDGISSLSWVVGEIRFVVTGPDTELLYDLIDRVRAIEPSTDRSGYEFVGGLPAGIVELDPPRPQAAGWFPGVLDTDGGARLSLYMSDQSPLQAVVQTGGDVRPVTVGGRPGYISTRNGAVIELAFAVATDETVSISYSPYSEAELIAIAERIEFADETTWRDHFGVDWGNP